MNFFEKKIRFSSTPVLGINMTNPLNLLFLKIMVLIGIDARTNISCMDRDLG